MVDDEGKNGVGKTSRRPEWQQTLKQVKGCTSSAYWDLWQEGKGGSKGQVLG